jgi:fructose-bisphosphate aldolase class II
MAKDLGASVEAELGRLKGVEDLVAVEERDAVLVDPREAARFVKETGVDYLAPAIGTSHGAFKFKGAGKLDMARLKEVRDLTGLPLVLHGASGLPRWVVDEAVRYGASIRGAAGVPDGQITEAMRLGVAKVNVDTDLRVAWVGALRRALTERPEEFDPRKLLGPAREAMLRVVKEKMELFGSAGKAS